MRDAMLGLINGFRLSQMIAVAAKLQVADHLRDGPQTTLALAQLTGSHPDSLCRVLRALAGFGVFAEQGPDLFALTPMGNWLRSDVEGSVRLAAEVVSTEWMWRPWGALAHTVKTGETAFDALYGQDTWTWFGDNPEAGRLFDGLMDEITRADADAIVAAFDFAPFQTIVDVAGGRGILLAEILRRNPGCRGVLFNVPAVIESARGAIPRELADRIELVSGDFFRAVPSGGDLYVLKNILHDWADAAAIDVLRTCRRAMARQTRLLVIEHFVCGPNERCPGKVGDIQMMVRNGGRNRSIADLTDLLSAGGFDQAVARRTPGGPDLLVAMVASDAA
jgi:hypothetical protein